MTTPRYYALGRLVGEILAEWNAYDDDPMSANAPSECRPLAQAGAVRAIRERIADAGYRTPTDLAEDLEARIGPRRVYELGVLEALDELDLEEEEIVRRLSPGSRSALQILYACDGSLPAWDPWLAGQGLLAENGLLSPLGRAVAIRSLRDEGIAF